MKNYIRDQDYASLLDAISNLLDHKYTNTTEQTVLRQELHLSKVREDQLLQQNQELNRLATTYKAKYEKTKQQKDSLLGFYKKTKV